MSAKAGVSEQEYLHTSFPDLDKEYRDGELVDRSFPDYLHGRTQALILVFFEALRRKLSLFAASETRLKLRSGFYRIPDVSVFHPAPPLGNPPDVPPFIVVEILSPDDPMTEVREKLAEYKAWGVAHVWLVDPHSKRMYTCDHGLTEVDLLVIADLGITLTRGDCWD